MLCEDNVLIIYSYYAVVLLGGPSICLSVRLCVRLYLACSNSSTKALAIPNLTRVLEEQV